MRIENSSKVGKLVFWVCFCVGVLLPSGMRNPFEGEKLTEGEMLFTFWRFKRPIMWSFCVNLICNVHRVQHFFSHFSSKYFKISILTPADSKQIHSPSLLGYGDEIKVFVSTGRSQPSFHARKLSNFPSLSFSFFVVFASIVE